MNINELWDKLIDYEGKEFHTKTGLPFSYEALDDKVIISRNGKKYHANEKDFLLVLNNPKKDRYFYRDNMRVSSYVLGIMSDPRIGAI